MFTQFCLLFIGNLFCISPQTQKQCPQKGNTFFPNPYFSRPKKFFVKKIFGREKCGLEKKVVPFLGYFFPFGADKKCLLGEKN